MTAVPRDPAFWRRFSVAIHQQEALTNPQSQPLNRDYSSTSSLVAPSPNPDHSPNPNVSDITSFHAVDLEKQDATTKQNTSYQPLAQTAPQATNNWLEHERKKQRRSKICLPLFFVCLIVLIVIVVLVLIWLSSHNWFADGGPVTIP